MMVSINRAQRVVVGLLAVASCVSASFSAHGQVAAGPDPSPSAESRALLAFANAVITRVTQPVRTPQAGARTGEPLFTNAPPDLAAAFDQARRPHEIVAAWFDVGAVAELTGHVHVEWDASLVVVPNSLAQPMWSTFSYRIAPDLPISPTGLVARSIPEIGRLIDQGTGALTGRCSPSYAPLELLATLPREIRVNLGIDLEATASTCSALHGITTTFIPKLDEIAILLRGESNTLFVLRSRIVAVGNSLEVLPIFFSPYRAEPAASEAVGRVTTADARH